MSYKLAYDPALLQKRGGIFIEHIGVGKDMEPYAAPYFLLVYTAHHGGKISIEGKTENIWEEDIFFIRPHVSVCFYTVPEEPGISMYCCAFLKSALPYELEGLKHDFPQLKSFLSGSQGYLRVRDTPAKDIRGFFMRMMDDFSFSLPCNEYTVKSLLNLAVIGTLKIAAAAGDTKPEFNKNALIGQIINFINLNIYRKFSASQLSRILHITPQHLSRVFRQNTGITLTEFTNRLRVEKIKDELEHTDRPIYIICDDFDFTPRYIYKLFLSMTGYTLQQYKNKFNYKIGNPLYQSPARKRELSDEQA